GSLWGRATVPASVPVDLDFRKLRPPAARGAAAAAARALHRARVVFAAAGDGLRQLSRAGARRRIRAGARRVPRAGPADRPRVNGPTPIPSVTQHSFLRVLAEHGPLPLDRGLRALH